MLIVYDLSTWSSMYKHRLQKESGNPSLWSRCLCIGIPINTMWSPMINPNFVCNSMMNSVAFSRILLMNCISLWMNWKILLYAPLYQPKKSEYHICKRWWPFVQDIYSHLKIKDKNLSYKLFFYYSMSFYESILIFYYCLSLKYSKIKLINNDTKF